MAAARALTPPRRTMAFLPSLVLDMRAIPRTENSSRSRSMLLAPPELLTAMAFTDLLVRSITTCASLLAPPICARVSALSHSSSRKPTAACWQGARERQVLHDRHELPAELRTPPPRPPRAGWRARGSRAR